MYKIYGLVMGEKDSDAHRLLPNVPVADPKLHINCYMWCIKGEEATVLVDTGMNAKDAKHGGFVNIKDPVTLLKKLAVDAASISTVIVSHLHYDHFSAYQLYPKATFYIQRKDIEFFTGPAIRFPQVRRIASDMVEVVKLGYEKRICYLDGDEEILPGIRLVLVGGHSPGLQVVVVKTSKGDVVIGTDTMDLYRNMEEEVAHPMVDLAQGLLVWDKLKKLASSPELILPGHDCLIMDRFPNPVEGIAEIA
ncbi:N-acyl homoserine lactonase family protein [Chloroflexota bacterium]